MGLCWSTKTSSTIPPKPQSQSQPPSIARKEIFIIKHRNSHELHSSAAAGTSSSCTKDEVDSILIQCGRLSRSSSTGKASENESKMHSGFNNENDTIGREGENRRRERRRTPSRERDRDHRTLARLSSRRVSRSPGRRSESPISNRSNSNPKSRPARMISVPATVSSLINNNESNTVQRIEVRRNVSSPRVRSRSGSPAGVRALNETVPVLSLSRSSSRKGGHSHSPYRRNPLVEIDNRIAQMKVKQAATEERKGAFEANSNASSSSSSYTARLLEDIQNFHQKKNNHVPPSFPLPPCLTKACSILEAVADLNSRTSCDDRPRLPSLHTVRQRDEDLEEEEEEESSASNNQQRVSPESTDYWTSCSRPNELSTELCEGVKRERRYSEIGRSRIGKRPVMVSVPAVTLT